jgi:large subunit ribosomal protein L32e
MKEKLLQSKKAMKAKKPGFVRQDAHKKFRLRPCWRKPKGLQSKMRLKRSGYRRTVEVGYGSPSALRGLTNEGLLAVAVSNLADLKKIEGGMGALVPKGVGQKKRVSIAKRASELGIKVFNIKNIEEYLKSANEMLQKRREEKKKHIKEKEKRKEEREKKAVEKKKEDLAEKLTDEEKKEKEKKEREKILTKKES